MKGSLYSVFRVITLLLSVYSIGTLRSYIEPTSVQAAERAAPRQSSGGEELYGSLSNLETKALEAEKRNNWDEAAMSYILASRAARVAGQLQKGISYGNKALEIGEKVKDPFFQAVGLMPEKRLVFHRSLRLSGSP